MRKCPEIPVGVRIKWKLIPCGDRGEKFHGDGKGQRGGMEGSKEKINEGRDAVKFLELDKRWLERYIRRR